MRSLYLLLLCTITISAYAQPSTSHTFYFDFDKTTLTPASQKSLDSLLTNLQPSALTSVVVKGYTDAKGSNEYNTKLSLQRSKAIADELQKKIQNNVPLDVKFFGEQELLTNKEPLEHYNRRVTVVFFHHDAPTQNDVVLQGIFTDVPTQEFVVNLSDTVEVIGKDGTHIKIPPGSIQTKEGRTAKGDAKVCLKEYYESGDIMLAGVHSESEQGLLQTGGMFKLLLIQNSDTMAPATKKKVEVRMPVRNKELTGMSVYKRSAENDTATWDNTLREFTVVNEHWSWPVYERFWNVYHLWNHNLFNSLRKGVKVQDEYSVHSPLFGYKPYVKRVKLEFEKLDSAVVRVRAQIKYRRFGFKHLGIKNLDTTFLSTRIRMEYKALISNINWINCDRFYNTENRTDFYVSTPGYQGMNVVLYFKRLNAFMNARLENGQYKVDKVPVNEPVIIVGFGKKDNKYFFAKQSYLIDKNGLAKLTVQAVDEKEFDQRTQGLAMD